MRDANAAPNHILIRLSAINRRRDPAPLHILPHLWPRNDWSWFPGKEKPRSEIERSGGNATVLRAAHRLAGTYWLYCEPPQEALFTENESNTARLYGVSNASPHVKDAIHEFVVNAKPHAVNPQHVGTKAALHYSGRIGG